MTIRIHGDKIEFPDSTEQTTAASSIWSDVDGDAVLETDGKKLTVDANVGELGLKSRITTDASILELKAGSGGIADVSISDTEVILGADSVTKTKLKGTVNVNTDNNSIWGGGVIQSLGVQGRIVNKHTGGDATLIWRTDTGRILGFATGDTRKDLGGISTDGTNLYFDGLVTRTSQVEGLDKKLAIKDKIIEKLEARLTKLEARIK